MERECESFLAILTNLRMDRKLQLQKNKCSTQFQSHFPGLENQDMPLW